MHALSQRIKTARISPRTVSSIPGVSISTGPGVSVLSDLNIWNFDVITQYGIDMQIKMDSTWGFDADYPSTLQLYIQGSTSSETYTDDGEILFMFAVGSKYFAQMVSLDQRKTSFKECPRSFDPLIERNLATMINSVTPDRFHRFCKNSVSVPINEATDEWTNVASVYKKAAQWPMTITITNDPIANMTSYTWTDSMIIPNKVSSHYTSSFDANEGISIYLSGESPNEDFQIFSIDAIYQYTHIPTAAPTNTPTIEPSAYPTIQPTHSPTHHPTANPTLHPTEFFNLTREENVILVRQSEDSPISWFHALIIVGAFLTILIVWITIFGFIYYKKRNGSKSTVKQRKPVNIARPASNDSNRQNHKRVSVVDVDEQNELSQSDRVYVFPPQDVKKDRYYSESAMVAQCNVANSLLILPKYLNQLEATPIAYSNRKLSDNSSIGDKVTPAFHAFVNRMHLMKSLDLCEEKNERSETDVDTSSDTTNSGNELYGRGVVGKTRRASTFAQSIDI